MSETVSSTANDLSGVAADAVICSDELNQMADLDATLISKKKEIILAAAQKLQDKYADDTSIICAKVQKLFARDRVAGSRTVYASVSRRYVASVLPANFKRSYNTGDTGTRTDDIEDEDDTPANLTEELMQLFADLFGSTAGLARDTLDQLQELRRSDSAEDQAAYTKAMGDIQHILTHKGLAALLKSTQKQMCTIAQLSDALDFLKQMQIDVAAVKKMYDRRVKFPTATKLLLRMIFVHHSFAEVAAKLSLPKKYGAKWLAAINKDENLRRFSELTSCPSCGLQFERYIEAAYQAQQKGLPDPPAFSVCIPKPAKKGKRK